MLSLTETVHDEGANLQRLRRLNLFVRDDGRGFDPTEPIGFGFLGMQERVQALGGDYSVESEIGRGTCVRIAIPIPERSTQAICATARLRREHALIIDDHPVVLQGSGAFSKTLA